MNPLNPRPVCPWAAPARVVNRDHRAAGDLGAEVLPLLPEQRHVGLRARPRGADRALDREDLLDAVGRWAISGGIEAKAAAHFRRTAGLPGECKVYRLLRVHVKFLGYIS